MSAPLTHHGDGSETCSTLSHQQSACITFGMQDTLQSKSDTL